MDVNYFPALSEDTVAAAKAVFGRRNVYVNIGDLANTLFADIDLADLYPEKTVVPEFPYIQSIILVFQLHERIADRQAAEATRIRTDWKYALHLPLSHPGFVSDTLCDFRHRLLLNEPAQAQLHIALERLYNNSALPRDFIPSADTNLVLQSVCARNRLELVTAAMQAAVQTLVVTHYEWLRRILRPHWLLRYSRALSTFQLPDDLVSQEELAKSIGEDSLYLLETILHSDSGGLAGLAEIQTLKQIWDWQFEQHGDRCNWRAPSCNNCLCKTTEHSYRTGTGIARETIHSESNRSSETTFSPNATA
jgi:hypothetical protein